MKGVSKLTNLEIRNVKDSTPLYPFRTEVVKNLQGFRPSKAVRGPGSGNNGQLTDVIK